ncbi:hypothetical protein [Rhodopseudomonas sp. AAP120]|uniref:hypothetical protein n=1 Tax=Rhodopseudomonas sp. AAP120 TaxID=1523430 RepID=UPI000AF7220C|nr:hypothetical protein [Rhodopseudomonas sp. AAP120]
MVDDTNQTPDPDAAAKLKAAEEEAAKLKAAEEEAAKLKAAEEEARIEAKARELVAKQEAERAAAAQAAADKRRKAREARIARRGPEDAQAFAKERVRSLSEAVHRAVPYEARQHGWMAIPPEHPLNEQEHDVPDAVFRVLGRDWLLRFADGRLVEIIRATPRMDPSDYIEFA